MEAKVRIIRWGMQLGEKTQDSSHTVKPMKCFAGRELLYLFYFFKNLYEEPKEINIDKAPYWNHDCLLELAAAKSLQSCPTLCDPIESSPPGSPVPGILQARTLEWVAISFSNAWKWKVKVRSLSHVRLFATPWTAAYQAPPSMGFSAQEYWSGVPLPSPAGTGYLTLNEEQKTWRAGGYMIAPMWTSKIARNQVLCQLWGLTNMQWTQAVGRFLFLHYLD